MPRKAALTERAAPTVPKSIRLTEDEVRRVQRLIRAFPEVRSEADFLHQAFVWGMLVMATQATGTKDAAYGGYAPETLAALLTPRLLPAITFLAEQGKLPMLRASGPLDMVERPIAESEPIDLAAAADVEQLGGDFL